MSYNEICKCGHDKKAHLDDLNDPTTATDCFFNYNCDCKEWHPIILYVESYVDEDKYLHSARSVCCGYWLVTYNEEVDARVHWVGIGKPPKDLECRRCGKRVFE